MTDPKACAEEIMDRLETLDQGLNNARGFCAALQRFRTYDQLVISEPHAGAVQMVRAAQLRAAVGAVMATVDAKGTDRCSIAQILRMLGKADLSVFAHRWTDPTFGAGELQRAEDDWNALKASDAYRHCKEFRDTDVAHILKLVTALLLDEEFLGVLDAAEVLAMRLYRICAHGSPTFIDLRARHEANAQRFWDTYFKGAGLLSGCSEPTALCRANSGDHCNR